MNTVASLIAASRRFLLINPPIEDFTAYSLWTVPLGLLRVAAGLRIMRKEIFFLDLLDDPSLTLSPPSKPPRHRSDGRHGFWKTPVPKPDSLKHVPRRYYRFGATDEWAMKRLSELPWVPDAILLATGMTYWYQSLFHFVRLLRTLFPQVPIAVGGTAAQLMPEHFRIENLLVEERNLFPHVSLEVVSDILAQYPVYPLQLVYGCPFQCRYCAASILHGGVRVGDLNRQAHALMQWHKNTGQRDAVFFDDALLWENGFYLREFLNCLKPGLFRFHVPNGIHLRGITPEIASFFAAFRFTPLRIGYETSGNRFDMKKEGCDLKEAVTYLLSAGYHPTEIGVYLLCGLPKQTVAEVERAIDEVVAAGGRPYLNEYSPVPKTPLFGEHLAESHYDFQKEPLWQNNVLSSYRSPVFTPAVMKYLKSRLASLYREMDGGFP